VVDPDQTEALFLLAIAVGSQGNHAEAAELLGRAIRQAPSVANFHGQLGNVLSALGRYEEAVQSFQRALALAPEDSDHYNNLGNVFRAMGKLEETVECYRTGLSFSERHPSLLLNLGTALQQQGKIDEAIGCYRRLLALQPQHADGLQSLANALREQDRLAEALETYEKLLDLKPELAMPHLNLGIEFQNQGKLEEAVRCYEKVLALCPDLAAAHNNLGSVRRLQEKYPEALASLQKAIELDPKMVIAHNNLGVVLQAQQKWDEALAAMEAARTLDPDNPEAYNNIGSLYSSQEKFELALEWFGRALALKPEYAEVENNRGNVLRELGKLDEASECYGRCLRLKPDFADAHSNLGNALKEMGSAGAAISAYSRAIALNPENAGYHWNRALAALGSGDLERGWRDYHWGFGCKQRKPLREFPQPRWEGPSLTGRTILTWGEQGVGDEILFAECIPDLSGAADHCVVECDLRLVPLFARSFPDCEVLPRSEPANPRTGWPDIDLQAPMGDLPRWFRPSLDRFPRRQGYLRPDPAGVACWRQRLAELGGGMKVGVSWRSRLMASYRRKHYVPLDQWGPILSVPGAQFVNLQYSDYAEDIADAENRFGVHIHDFGDLNLKDALDDVAALISALDLVITISNVNLALGGAVGIPTWFFAVRHSQTWSTLGLDDPPWFPNARGFFRNWNENWEEPVRTVAKELSRLQDTRRLQAGCADQAFSR